MPSTPTQVIRERTLPGPELGTGSYVAKHSGMWIAPYETSYSVSLGKAVDGTQKTVSEGHQWPPRKGRTGDIGGDFSTAKTYVEFNKAQRTFHNPVFLVDVTRSQYEPYQILDWSGREIVRNTTPYLAIDPSSVGSSAYPRPTASSDASLMKMGATAISRCKPTNSVADLSTFLGETLREGLPRLVGASVWKDRTRLAKKAGGEYLNVEFGWKPIISDIRKLAYAISNAERVIAQYEKDAGKQVRRRYRFPSERHSSSVVVEENVRPYGLFHSDIASKVPRGTLVRTDESVRDVWFSGAFTYHLPTGYDSRSKFLRNSRIADKLLGLDLTPELIWNLTPWSWAVDWFANAGDVLSNVSDMATDGLVMRYGYIMEHTVNRVTYTLVMPPGSALSALPAPVSFVQETKIRRQANPFGFGISWDGLSPRQLAIAAALGISRGK
jgi:hypothetical protein